MSDAKVLQARCEAVLVERVERYKNDEELNSDSAAVRKLLIFALDILDSSADAPPISNRQLLEEIFAVTRENGAMICQTHAFTYHTNITDDMRDNSKEMRANAKGFGRDVAEKFLEG